MSVAINPAQNVKFKPMEKKAETYNGNIIYNSENREKPENLKPATTEQLSDIAINLNISRKNFLIYPKGHLQVTQSIDRTYEKLKLLLAKNKEIVLGVANDQLFLGDASLDERNSIFKELAASLKNIDIACVTFFQNLEKEDLSKFLSLLVKNTGAINEIGGINKVIEKESFKTIRISTTDYSKLYLTEEEEIKKNNKQKSGTKPVFEWKSFVANLISGTLSNTDGSVSITDLDEGDAARLAQYLNDNQIDIKSVIANYENLINSHLSNETRADPSSKSDHALNMPGLNTLLTDLNPTLRKQFLSSTLEQCSSKSAASVNTFMDGLTKNLIVEMIEDANIEGREISPSLLGLIQKIASTQIVETGVDTPDNLATADSFSKFNSENIKNLFERENYENYVTSEYNEMLTEMSVKSKQPALEKTEGFSIDDYMETLEESHIDFQIAQIIVAFMDSKSTTEEYIDYTEKLFSIIDAFDFSNKKYFNFIFKVFKTIDRHSKVKKSEEIKAVAKKRLDKFKEPVFISKILKGFDKMGAGFDPAAFELLKSIGSAVIPDALSMYGNKDDMEEKGHLLNLLISLGVNSATEAAAALSDVRSNWVKNMIVLIKELNYEESASKLKPFMEHRDEGVRMEAMATLLKFNNPWARIALNKTLHSDNPLLVSRSILFAGMYKVKEVVPDLIAMIKPNSFFASDYEQNEIILKTLGEIGDIEAIPTLEKLSKLFFSLRPSSLAKMKIALFESLKGYPYKSVSVLVRAGRNSPDEAIRNICKEISMAQKREKY